MTFDPKSKAFVQYASLPERFQLKLFSYQYAHYLDAVEVLEVLILIEYVLDESTVVP